MVRLGDIYGGRTERRLAAAGMARQGHLRPGRLLRPREDAPRPRRRHDRIRQVGIGQRDPHLDAPARLAERAPPRPRRPQAGRAQPLRLGAAPVDTGRDERPRRRQRAREPRRRDGVPLHGHGQGTGTQPRGAQQDPPQGRGGAASPHPLRHRLAGQPDHRGPWPGRGLDHPARPEVARRRHPPAPGHPAPLDRRHHRDDQGQHPRPDRLRRRLAGRLAGDPRPGRRRVAARPGRHAVPAGRVFEAAARPGRLRDRGGDREGRLVLGQAGRAEVRPGPPRREASGRRGWGRRRRVLPGRGRSARGRRPDLRRDRDRLPSR